MSFSYEPLSGSEQQQEAESPRTRPPVTSLPPTAPAATVEQFQAARQEFEKVSPFGQPPTASAPSYNFSAPYLATAPGSAYSAQPVVAIPVTNGTVEPTERPVQVEFANDAPLGTDSEFFGFFCLSMLFGLIGFLISLCIAATHAGRLGARAGFGIALCFSGFYTLFTWGDSVDAHEYSTFYYAISFLIILLGSVTFGRSVGLYRRLKRMYASGIHNGAAIPMQPVQPVQSAQPSA